MWNLRSLSAWQDRYRALASREKLAIIVALTAILTFLFFQLVFFPMIDSQSRLELSIKTKENDLSELRSIVAQYKRLWKNRSGTGGEEQGKAFNLFSVLEKLATKSGLMDKIDYMKPGTLQLDNQRAEKWVEIKLSQLTLKEVTDYLYNLQSFGKGIYIKRLSARKQGRYLDLVMQPAVLEIR